MKCHSVSGKAGHLARCVTLLLLAVMSGEGSAVTAEVRWECPPPMAGTTDETYAPSLVTFKATQDDVSRYVIGRAMWHRDYYWSYFREKQAQGFPLGFEIEFHFYNYDDSVTTGYGPAYMRGWTCETDNSIVNTVCQMIPTGLLFCNLPNCYQDTQALSFKNSVGEYRQPQLAFGSFDGSKLTTGMLYLYGSRGASGRGNKSLFKVNFQPTRRIVPLVLDDILNQGACGFNAATVSGDVALVPMGGAFGHIYAPVSMRIWYKYLDGITLRYEFPPL